MTHSESLHFSTHPHVIERKRVKDIEKSQRRFRFRMHALMASHETNSDVTAALQPVKYAPEQIIFAFCE